MNQTHDTSKLPTWAQVRIAHLENRLASAQAALTAGPKDSDTVADPFSEAPRPLGSGLTVRFGIRGSGATYDVTLKNGELDVRVSVSLREEMVIKPRVSNAFRVASVMQS
jgi:hypothetical protein